MATQKQETTKIINQAAKTCARVLLLSHYVELVAISTLTYPREPSLRCSHHYALIVFVTCCFTLPFETLKRYTNKKKDTFVVLVLE